MDHPRITQNPAVMFGKPCIRGTRITVEILLRNIGAGLSAQDVAEDYEIAVADVHAAAAYAADYLSNEVGVTLAAE